MPDEVNLTKKTVQFVRKPARSGRTYMFVIPADFVRWKYIDPERTYRVYVEELTAEEVRKLEKKGGPSPEGNLEG